MLRKQRLLALIIEIFFLMARSAGSVNQLIQSRSEYLLDNRRFNRHRNRHGHGHGHRHRHEHGHEQEKDKDMDMDINVNKHENNRCLKKISRRNAEED